MPTEGTLKMISHLFESNFSNAEQLKNLPASVVQDVYLILMNVHKWNRELKEKCLEPVKHRLSELKQGGSLNIFVKKFLQLDNLNA